MNKNPLKDFARSLAVELTAADFPNIWRVKAEPGNWWADLYTAGAWLHLSEGDRGRLKITADRPRQMERAECAEHITVNKERPLEEIARDVMRRILPHARAHFKKCQAYSRKRKQERKAHAAIIETFKPYARFIQTNSADARSTISTHGARFEMYNDTVSDARLYSVTPAQLLQILAILEPTPKE